MVDNVGVFKMNFFVFGLYVVVVFKFCINVFESIFVNIYFYIYFFFRMLKNYEY